MNPTSSQLITAIADALRTRIAPLLADQPWPASELRTIDALLAHLAARVEHEHAVLVEDDEDLDRVLAQLSAAGLDVRVSGTPGSIDAGNLARRAALEAAIHELHDGAHPGEVELVRSYLRRASQREQAIFGPLTSRPLF